MKKEIWEEDEPMFEHDCDNCKFLGLSYMVHRNSPVDLYVCVHELEATIVARFGNDPSSNYSADLFIAIRLMFKHIFIRDAIKRAMYKNYITKDILWENFQQMHCLYPHDIRALLRSKIDHSRKRTTEFFC